VGGDLDDTKPACEPNLVGKGLSGINETGGHVRRNYDNVNFKKGKIVLTGRTEDFPTLKKKPEMWGPLTGTNREKSSQHANS